MGLRFNSDEAKFLGNILGNLLQSDFSKNTWLSETRKMKLAKLSREK